MPKIKITKIPMTNDLNWEYEEPIQRAFEATNELAIDAVCWGTDKRELAGKTIMGVIERLRAELRDLREAMKQSNNTQIINHSNGAVNNAGILRGILATHEFMKENVYQRAMANALDAYEGAVTNVTALYLTDKCR